MRKLHKAVAVAAFLGSVSLLGVGTAIADGGPAGKFDIKQSASCTSHDTNLDVLGEVGIANGLGGNLLNGEGSPGAQKTHLGSTVGCDNSAFGK
ncbi:hypothetical protein QOM21_09670 [Streptomyces sp. Pv4-95]|uniref:hypothetical protein n=1 Tax=Streptomyces sp. Pv4-95 TaxID=3049543 RepID=UPI003891DB61